MVPSEGPEDTRLHMITRDHFHPKADGGKGKKFNIVRCCYECNQMRGKINQTTSNLKKIELLYEYKKKKPGLKPMFCAYIMDTKAIRKFANFLINGNTNKHRPSA